MTTLAKHAPPAALVAARHVTRPGASNAIGWREVAAEAIFVLGLCALCIAFVALRMAVWPEAFVPRGLAFAAFGAAALASIGTFLTFGAIRRK